MTSHFSPVIATLVSIVALAAGCSSQPKTDETSPLDLTRLEDHIPVDSSGRRPAGTREDPFVGIGVISAIIPAPNEGLVRVDIAHRPIPYFKNAMKMGVYVQSDVVEGVNEGDFIRLEYAKLIDGTRAAIEFKKAKEVRAAAKPARARPHVWFGYELFRITSIPDQEYWRTYAPKTDERPALKTP